MPKPLGPTQRLRLMADLCNFGKDVIEIGQHHKLDLDRLASIYGDAAIQCTLRNIAALAELQSQILAARYRQIAIRQLLDQAAGKADQPEELKRKAANDVLGISMAAPSPAATDAHRREELEALERDIIGPLAKQLAAIDAPPAEDTP